MVVLEVSVSAPGLAFSASGEMQEIIDALTLRMSDEELKGGVFALAIKDADECGSHVKVFVTNEP